MTDSLFHTGLLVSDYFRFPPPPYHGNRWHLNFILPPTELPIGSTHFGDKIYPAKEVVIFSETKEKEQRAANLIHAARLLLDASNFLSHIHPGDHAPIYAANVNCATNLELGESEFLKHQYVQTMNIPLACLVAARASLGVQFVYALARLRLSFETFSIPFIELDPSHSENVPKSVLLEDHVRLAFAMVAAYACIEELGLEMRASSTRPSKMADGSWNQVVKDELESRLRRSHINLKERSLWNLRGPQTRIERKRTPIIIQKAAWARYQVRDGEMEVIDAIHYLSSLRSWVAAHKTDKRMLRVLSVYDVANAQFLARRLLLERMGFWRYWGE